MKFQEGNTVGKQFPKGVSGNPNGRPKKNRIKILLESLEATPLKESEQKEIDCALLTMTVPELNRVIKDEGQTIYARTKAKELVGNRGFQAIETMCDRAFGKPRQQQEVTVTNERMVPQINFIKSPEGTESDESEC